MILRSGNQMMHKFADRGTAQEVLDCTRSILDGPYGAHREESADLDHQPNVFA